MLTIIIKTLSLKKRKKGRAFLYKLQNPIWEEGYKVLSILGSLIFFSVIKGLEA